MRRRVLNAIRAAIARLGASALDENRGCRKAHAADPLSDEELVSRIAALCLEGRRLVARLIVHLIEVEDRALDKKSACSSMWEFCTQRLKMSDGEASRRLNATRLVRRFPSVLGRIERGEIHLSALRQLRPYLDEENVDAVLDEAKGKTRRQLDEMTTATAGARVEPLSATGVLVQMTMTAEGYADLKRAKELLGHCIPDGDTVKVIERALRTPAKPGHIAAATRREVFARDGERCTYVDTEGRRCVCRTRIELDRIQPRARGGGDEASNLRARCRSHKLHAAEEIFGKEHVAARIRCRQQQWRKRGEDRTSMSSATLEQARRGLVHMGFAVSDVNKTLVALADRHRDAGAPPVPELLREAIAALT